MAKKDNDSFQYDVCLSFAGENRKYVREVADALRKSGGLRIFYDEYEQVDMWGKDLYVHLDEIYQNTAKYCVLFASKHYAQKVWTNHERQSAQARAMKQNSEYILPAKFDDTQIPGLRPTIGYLELKDIIPEELAKIIIKKVGKPQAENYFPPEPDRLYKRLKLKSEKSRTKAYLRAYNFFKVLQRMTHEEREVIFQIIICGCPVELPENIHIKIDNLRRITNFSVAKIKRLVGGLSSLGFDVSYRDQHEHDDEAYIGKDSVLVIEWHDMSVDKNVFGNATMVVSEMVGVALENFCEECGMINLRKLNFSQLATVTTTVEE